MVFDAGRRLIYTTHTYRKGGYGEPQEKGHELSVIDVDRQQITDVIDIAPYFAPHDVDYDPGADLIYAGVERYGGTNGLVVVSARSREVIDNIPLDAPNVHWFTITPDGARAYATSKAEPYITVVDLNRRAQLRKIPCEGGAEEIACSPDGRWVFAVGTTMRLNAKDGVLTKRAAPEGMPRPRLVKIDTTSDTIVGEVSFDEYQSALSVTPNGLVLVSEMRFASADDSDAAAQNGYVHIVSADSLEILASIETDVMAFTSRTSPDGKRAFVANYATGSTTVIDLDAMKVIATLDNHIGRPLGGSHGMAYVPASQAPLSSTPTSGS